MSRHVEKLGSVHTKCQFQVTVLGTDPVLEIGTILRHLNGCNFLIPNPRELVTPHFKGILMAFPAKQILITFDEVLIFVKDPIYDNRRFDPCTDSVKL